MSMFLDKSEIIELTDRAYKSLQIKWLRENKIPFQVSAMGHPKVARSFIEGKEAPAKKVKAAWVPRVLSG